MSIFSTRDQPTFYGVSTYQQVGCEDGYTYFRNEGLVDVHVDLVTSQNHVQQEGYSYRQEFGLKVTSRNAEQVNLIIQQILAFFHDLANEDQDEDCGDQTGSVASVDSRSNSVDEDQDDESVDEGQDEEWADVSLRSLDVGLAKQMGKIDELTSLHLHVFCFDRPQQERQEITLSLPQDKSKQGCETIKLMVPRYEFQAATKNVTIVAHPEEVDLDDILRQQKWSIL